MAMGTCKTCQFFQHCSWKGKRQFKDMPSNNTGKACKYAPKKALENDIPVPAEDQVKACKPGKLQWIKGLIRKASECFSPMFVKH